MISSNTGVIIVNLGTPNSLELSSVKEFLKQFLSDPQVIRINPIIWQIILYTLILPLRSPLTKRKYEKIWFQDYNSSPLKYFTQLQVCKLQKNFNSISSDFTIDYAMRYGLPSIGDRIKKFLIQGYKKLIFIPLYPQYCSVTTGSMYDEIFRVIKDLRYKPEIKIVSSYHENRLYINALVNSIKKHLSSISFIPEVCLFSYHGIPKKYFVSGDPYIKFCYRTYELVCKALLEQKIYYKTYISFQSRFGFTEWVKPYTSDTIKDLLKQGIKKIIVVTPSFITDCIETLEEVNIEYKELFLKLGGEYFSFVPCLNDSDDAVELITNLIQMQ